MQHSLSYKVAGCTFLTGLLVPFMGEGVVNEVSMSVWDPCMAWVHARLRSPLAVAHLISRPVELHPRMGRLSSNSLPAMTLVFELVRSSPRCRASMWRQALLSNSALRPNSIDTTFDIDTTLID